MRVAAIDIGTNTILMLVADVSGEGVLSVVRDEHAIARLGQGVDRERRISPEAIGRADDVLRRHLDLARELKAVRIVAVGTSALRDAANRTEVLQHWREQFGLDVRVISSDEEARLTYRGSFSVGHSGTGPRAVLDIGGGSTEVTLGRRESVIDRFSVDLGAVRLTERFWASYPPHPADIERARELTVQTLISTRPSLPAAEWHAVAGTPTTLAALALSLATFDVAAIDGFRLTRSFVSAALSQITALSLGELRQHPQIHPQRADIMGAGALILEAVMEVYDIPEVTVSVKGLRYGAVLEGVKRVRRGY